MFFLGGLQPYEAWLNVSLCIALPARRMMGLGLEVQLKLAVEESLAHYATDNAVFMAERLAACNP